MTDILPRDVLLYAGGDAWKRFGTFTRRAHRIQRGGEGQQETFSRADGSTCASHFGLDGLIHTAAANVMRPHLVDTNGDGVVDTLTSLHEPAATNIALWCRDLTNATWAKTNCSAVKNQIGLDGVANSCCTLTASAGNATCLQTVTLSSSQRVQSAWVRHIAGTGTIQMTTDGGTTWTTIAVPVSGAWARLSIPAQTVTNPSFGFRIVTSGDAIAVDFVQNETGATMTAELLTGASAVTRAADACTVPVASDAGPITFYVKFIERGAILSGSGSNRIMEIGRFGVNPRFLLFQSSGKYLADFISAGGTVYSVFAAAAPNYGDTVELVGSYDGSSLISLTQAINGGAGVTTSAAAATPGAAVWGTGGVGIFCDPNGGSNTPGALVRAMIVQGVHTLAECQAVP